MFDFSPFCRETRFSSPFHKRGSRNLSDNPINPSPLMGEGKGGGGKDGEDLSTTVFPLLFIPSHKGRGNQLSDSLPVGISSELLQIGGKTI
jgi:hypothetical protein